MTSTPNPACPLCGLGYASKPLLELHIREDHRPRHRAQPGPLEAGGTGVSSPAADSPSRRPGLASRPARTVKEVTAMTATRRPRIRQVMTVPRRVLRALRHANDELMRTSEAIICSARAPQSRPHPRRPRPGALTRIPPPNELTGPPDRPPEHSRQWTGPRCAGTCSCGTCGSWCGGQCWPSPPWRDGAVGGAGSLPPPWPRRTGRPAWRTPAGPVTRLAEAMAATPSRTGPAAADLLELRFPRPLRSACQL